MTMLLLIAWGILAVSLVFLLALRPQRTHHSRFELKRRDDQQTLRRERYLDDVYAIIRFYIFVTLVMLTVLSLVIWQWWGIAIIIGVILFALIVAAQKGLQHAMTKAYEPYEEKLLQFVEKFPLVGRLLGRDHSTPRDQHLESVEQLLHLVEGAGHILSPDQQNIVRHGLSWHQVQVKEVMTKRRDIVAIKHNELVGPLVLDDLHRSGYSRFPVMQANVDNVIGVLNITDLLDIHNAKKSHTAEKVMAPQVLRIEEDEPLPQALSLLQKSHQHLMIVVDEEGNTTGLVTLTDIMRSLLGK